MWKIIIKKDDKLINEYVIGDKPFILGRAKDNEILLDDTSVSRKHAKILVQEGSLLISDLGSSNGTFVNGERISTSKLIQGDRVQIGIFAIEPLEEKIAPQAGLQGDRTMMVDKTIVVDEIASQFILKLESGKDAPKEILLKKDTYVIGRSEECDIPIDDRSASRKHAEIGKKGSEFIIRDLGSSNGTKVNGEVIKEKTLHHGDEIVIGSIIFRFISAGMPLAPAAPSFPSKGVEAVGKPVFQTGEVKAPIKKKRKIVPILMGFIIIFLVVITLAYILLREPAQVVETQQKEVQAKTEMDEKTRFILKYLTDGKSLYSENKLNESLEMFKKITYLDPEHKEARDYIMRIEVEIKKAEEEKQKKQVEIAEKEKKIQEFMSAGKKLMSEKKFIQAQAEFEKVLNINPNHSEAQELFSKVKTEKSRMEVAQRRAQEEATKTAKAIEEHFEQGSKYMRSGQELKAITEFKEVIALDPSAKDPRTQQSKKIIDEAYGKLNQKVQRDYEEGMRFYREGQMSRAIARWNAVLAVHPAHQPTIDGLKQAEAKVTDTAQQLYREGLVHESLNDIDSAKDKWKKVIELVPNPNNEYNRKAQEKLKKYR